MAKQATGQPAAKKAVLDSPSGSRKGMAVGPSKSTAKLSNVAKPVVNKGPIAGVKTNPKKNVMYTGKPSKLGKTTVQLDKLSRGGSGIVDDNGKGYENNMPDRKKGSGRPV